jgi:HK97 gp10 family phage protein
MTQTSWKNRRRAMRRIRAIPDEIRIEVRQALAENAQELVAMMKRLVPVDNGDLRDSIGWTFGDAPDGAVTLGDLGTGSDTLGSIKVTVFAGNRKAYYAWFVEHGTERTPARPFFFVAYRALRRRLKSRLGRARSKGVKKAIARG